MVHVGVRGTITGVSTAYSNYDDTLYCENAIHVVDWRAPKLESFEAECLDSDNVLIGVNLTDESEIVSAEILWRKTATDWARESLVQSDGQWTCLENLTLPELNSTRPVQLRVIAEDYYGNTLESNVFEMSSMNVTTSPTQTMVDQMPIELLVAGIGGALILGVIAIAIRRRKAG